jgi:hypothetical protein
MDLRWGRGNTNRMQTLAQEQTYPLHFTVEWA